VTLIATEHDLRAVVRLDLEVVDRIAAGFRALSDGAVAMPPILHMDLPFINAEVDVKMAYVRTVDGFAVKVSPGFFDNPRRGLPSTSGFMVVLDAATGRVRAVLLDNGYLTDVRTAAAGAVAARALASPDVGVAGVLGAGVQARLQVVALSLVRPIHQVVVWGRDPGRAASLAASLRDELGVLAESAPTPEQVVRSAEVLVTATPARGGLVKAAWLHPGLHITAIGADAPGKQELGGGVLEAADVIVCDRLTQARVGGELQHVGRVVYERAVELGDVLTGRAAGRTSSDQISVCDLTGTGVQDTLIATLAERRLQGSEAWSSVESGKPPRGQRIGPFAEPLSRD
jgi:ectoine utilization protein EutC